MTDLEELIEEVEKSSREILEEGKEIYRGESEGDLSELLAEYAEGWDVGTGPEYEVQEWEDFLYEHIRITRDIYEMILND